MRGEDAAWGVVGPGITGSPPHARGRLEFPEGQRRPFGITPACAGKTLARRQRWSS